uniref:MARVEL domain-containing protein n=1 Tax=Panagrolaimus sp. JU765 TaxID=591449 RepID=A0AC34RHT0_9BILA
MFEGGPYDGFFYSSTTPETEFIDRPSSYYYGGGGIAGPYSAEQPAPTQTEWQGCVVGLVATFGILTLLLLVTIYYASRQAAWRKLDAYVGGLGAFLYIVVAFLESYFAACYPPNGKFHPEVCHRAEWIIACILAYFNIIAYLADFVLALRTGISLL